MGKKAIIYHNPRCAKSRQALALLEEQGVEPTVIEYLKKPLTAAQLWKLVEMLGVKPHDILRTNEPEYKEARLSPSSSDKEVIRAIAKHPKLLERPIVLRKGKARIGRPPEKVLEIL